MSTWVAGNVKRATDGLVLAEGNGVVDGDGMDVDDRGTRGPDVERPGECVKRAVFAPVLPHPAKAATLTTKIAPFMAQGFIRITFPSRFDSLV